MAILGMLEAEEDGERRRTAEGEEVVSPPNEHEADAAPLITEDTAAKVDQLLEETSTHQEAERARQREEEERKAAEAKGTFMHLQHGLSHAILTTLQQS